MFTIIIEKTENGTPYQIFHIPVPLNFVVDLVMRALELPLESEADTDERAAFPKKKKEKKEPAEGPKRTGKLDEEKVAEIENLLLGKHSVSQTCELAGVSYPTVSIIKRRLITEGRLPE